MGLFSREKKVSALQDELAIVLRTLIDVKADQEIAKAKFRSLEMEWVNTHDKLKHIMGRLSKRDQRERDEPPEAPGGGNSEQAPGPYDHLDPVSKGIMERRSRR